MYNQPQLNHFFCMKTIYISFFTNHMSNRLEFWFDGDPYSQWYISKNRHPP